MNEKSINELLQLLNVMTDEIKSLKSWRNEIMQRQAEEEAKAEQSNIEFQNWLSQRKAAEQREKEASSELRKMMM